MFKSLGLAGLFLMMGLTTGCSLDSSLTGLSLEDLIPFQKTQGAEIVAGSTQYFHTANNYKVNASAGNVYDQLRGTTSNGYKVYITVQGQMISDNELNHE